MNGGHLGFLFTAKDLASGAFARQNKNVQSLASNSTAAAAIYERNMERMKRGAVRLGVAVVGLAAMVKVTKTFGEFQYVLASAGAVMHATANEMKTLERAAIDAGIATQFSPREAAEGLQALGAAGLNVAQSVKVLNPVLDLAAASMGQLGVAGAAENVVGVLNAFSMQADRAGEVSDKLTRISQLTNFQFRDFGVAISQAASQGAAADQTFESMIATLGMLRNTNLHASAAATAYREAVRRLSGDKRAQRELSKLNVEVLDKETGKIRDLGAIMAELAPRLEKLNSKEKNLRATRIFGVRGMKTYSAFVAQYHKLVKEGTVVTGDWAGAHTRLVTELGNSDGAAKKNRDALLKTAEGQRLLLKGSWETTQIMLGKLALPVVLPALKALTDVLNKVIKLIDAIPGPLRSMIANFLGVGLAIKGVVGAFGLLRGIAGIAMLGRMAGAAEGVSAATDSAAKKTGRLASATGKLRAGLGSIAAGFGRWLPAIGVGVAAMAAVFSYMRQKEAEEMARQKQIRKDIVLSKKAYEAAWKMAERLRGATARAADAELNAAGKSFKAAAAAVSKYSAQHFELSNRVKNARRDWLLMNQAHGATAKQTRDARTKYIQLSGQLEATNTAVIASEAILAKFQLRRAKTQEDRQVLATRIIADRMNKQRAMVLQLSRTEKVRERAIQLADGADKRRRQRQWDAEKKRSRQMIDNYERESARMAVRYKIGDKTLLQDKKRRAEALRGIAAPRRAAVAGAAPGARFMGVAGGGVKGRGMWDAALRHGHLPPLTAAQVPEFLRYLKTRGGEADVGMTPAEIEAMQQRALLGRRGAIGKGPGFVFGGAPARGGEPAPRRRGGGGAEKGLIERGLESILSIGGSAQVGLAQAIADAFAIAEAKRGREATHAPINIYLDSEKIATAVENAGNRRNRQQDGTQSAQGGTQGAG